MNRWCTPNSCPGAGQVPPRLGAERTPLNTPITKMIRIHGVLGPPHIGGGCRPPEECSFSSHFIQGQVSQLFEEIDHQPDDQFEINWCCVDSLFLVYFSSSIGVGERFSGVRSLFWVWVEIRYHIGVGFHLSLHCRGSIFVLSIFLLALPSFLVAMTVSKEGLHPSDWLEDLWGRLSPTESCSLGQRCSPCLCLSCRCWSGRYEWPPGPTAHSLMGSGSKALSCQKCCSSGSWPQTDFCCPLPT